MRLLALSLITIGLMLTSIVVFDVVAIRRAERVQPRRGHGASDRNRRLPRAG